MKVNKRTDLAVRILKYLYQKQYPNFISGNIIATELNISYHHLRRIVPILNELGFTTSKHGQSGGIKLTEDANSIPIRQLLLKTELSNECINDCDNCIFKNTCTFETYSKEASLRFCDYFSDIYLSDL